MPLRGQLSILDIHTDSNLPLFHTKYFWRKEGGASMQTGQAKPLLRALAGEALSPPPWGLMRQAGRYLPEYRDVRGRARDSVGLWLTPELAARVAVQRTRGRGMEG